MVYIDIHHTIQIYSRQGHFEVCLTRPSNMGRVETVLDTFSTFRIFLVKKFVKMDHFMTFYYKKYAKS